MKRTLEEINNDITALIQERNRANAVTADGFDIEIGKTYYVYDGFSLQTIVVPEKVNFQETHLQCYEPYVNEDYKDLFVDPKLATKFEDQRLRNEVARTRNILKAQKERLAKFRESVNEKIESKK